MYGEYLDISLDRFKVMDSSWTSKKRHFFAGWLVADSMHLAVGLKSQSFLNGVYIQSISASCSRDACYLQFILVLGWQEIYTVNDKAMRYLQFILSTTKQSCIILFFKLIMN